MMKRAVETEETKSTAFEGALREREGEVGSSDVDCILAGTLQIKKKINPGDQTIRHYSAQT